MIETVSIEALRAFCVSKPTEFDAFMRQWNMEQAELAEQQVKPVEAVPVPELTPEPAPVVTTKKVTVKKAVEPEPVASPSDSAVNTASTTES